MRELSVFADESGDTGNDSRLYLLTLVFHDQNAPLGPSTRAYETAMRNAGLQDIPFHMQPLLCKEGDYEHIGVSERARMLDKFHAYSVRCPIEHATFCYDKKQFDDFQGEIPGRMATDIESLMKSRYKYVLGFDRVKIYYDNGQAEVTKSLHAAFEKTLSSNVPVFKEGVTHRKFRLCQVADMVCGFEYLAKKFEKGSPVAPTNSDLLFFDDHADIRSRYLKKLKKLRFIRKRQRP